jgi:VWFA-related protein
MAFNALAFIAVVLLLPSALAQSSGQPQEVRIHSGPYRPPSTTISVQANLVELAATVRDRKGTPVGGFHGADFQVLDNGKPQAITHFSEQRAEPPTSAPSTPASADSPPSTSPTVQPRFLALFFDDTHSGMAGFERSKRAAEKLFAGGLHPGDRIGIFTSSGAVTLDFTADTKALAATLAALKRHPEPTAARGWGPCPTLSTYQAFVIARHIDERAKQIAVEEILACEPGTPYWVAVQEAQSAGESAWDLLRHEPSRVLDALTQVARHLAAQPGTRVLLMVSPGFVTDGMDRETATLVDTCLRHRIVINALDNEGLLSGGADSPESLGQFQGPRADWAERSLGQRNLIVQGFMVDATESTGGEFIHNNNDLNRGLEALTAVPPVSYMLGISPAEQPDGKYHKLKVTVTKPGNYDVSARPGYFSTPGEKPPETARQRIDRLALSTESLAEIPATVKVQSVEDKDDRYRIQVDIAIDAKSLAFADQNGVAAQQLTFVTILEDAKGNYMEGKEAVMDMNLSSKTRADLEATGIKAATSFLVPRGSYQIREIIREAVQNHLAAITTSLPIP